ncbi:hypothetical protein PILCRDRAFT_12490 [Piloderma croceum F 1598]|uniref:Uncharacterized protein n=1 Tax=Piloderma croceum (strain F 1598) TaxID=765440 RepID=A0A0C3BHE4_PILCF|nr:hypothetical protein PILCRDRAFT_12490 [Piloderma croceum F 1598]
MAHLRTGNESIFTQKSSSNRHQTESPATTLTMSERQVAIDEYEDMHVKSQTEVEEILRLSKTPADNKLIFGTMSKVTAANNNPDTEVFTFLTVCYKYRDHDKHAHHTLRDGSIHYVEQYTVRASEVDKNELLRLTDSELLERVLLIGEKRVHDRLGHGLTTVVKGPIWSVRERDEPAVYLLVYYERGE